MIDIEGLVAAELLDLDAVFARARWQVVDRITTYTACVYGSQGDEPGEIQMSLESATEYGIVAYRWAASDDGGVCECGPIVLDEDEARDAGEEYATQENEEPDANALIEQIVATGYFGDAGEDDILACCKEATQHSQGYILLPKGEFVGHPIGRMWTTSGYLQCKHICLEANYPSAAYAADALLRAVTAEDESN